jgi:hypothetical protein
MISVSTFLREKMGNMTRWLQGEGLNVTVPLHELSNLHLVAIAQTLHDEYLDAIEGRNFAALQSHTQLPIELLSAITFVESREELHDKFWRYLALFSDTVSSDE